MAFAKLYNWLLDAIRNPKIRDSRLDDEFSHIASRLSQYIVATDYATFDLAIAAAVAANKNLYVPNGAYTSAGNLALTNGISIIGENRGNTGVNITHATDPLFTLTGIGNVTISGLQIGCTTTRTSTSNGYINLSGACSSVSIENNYFVGAYNAIVSDGSIAWSVSNNIISVVTNGFGITLGANTGGVAESIYDNLFNGPGFAAIAIISTGDVILRGNQIGGSSHGLYISPGNGQGVHSIKSIGNFYDQATTSNVTMAPHNSGAIDRSTFTSDWMSGPTTSTGVSMGPTSSGTIKGVSFIDCEFYLNDYGIVADATSGAVNGILVLGGFFAQNASVAILLTGVLGGVITGALIGATGGFTANGTGIDLAAGTDFIAITGNVCVGNTTANFTDTSGGANSRGTGNIGITDF